jgi:hypothetical protein
VGIIRMLEARIRSAGGKTRNNMAIPTGVMRPPAAPWSTRNTTSSPRLPARPHRADEAVKSTTEKSSTFRPPKRSPIHPEAARNTPVLTRKAMTTLSTASGLVWKSRPITGRATLTIVVSMMAMNRAAT